jgi:hypothetical protein
VGVWKWSFSAVFGGVLKNHGDLIASTVPGAAIKPKSRLAVPNFRFFAV